MEQAPFFWYIMQAPYYAGPIIFLWNFLVYGASPIFLLDVASPLILIYEASPISIFWIFFNRWQKPHILYMWCKPQFFSKWCKPHIFSIQWKPHIFSIWWKLHIFRAFSTGSVMKYTWRRELVTGELSGQDMEETATGQKAWCQWYQGLCPIGG